MYGNQLVAIFFRAWLVRIICSDKVYWVEKAASRMGPSSERSIGL